MLSARSRNLVKTLPTELQVICRRHSWSNALHHLNPLTKYDRPSSVRRNAGESSFLDPFSLVANELGSLRANVRTLLGSGHPALDTIAKYYFQTEGKHFRPLIILLIAQATNGLSPHFFSLSQRQATRGETSIDAPLSEHSVLTDVNPSDPFWRKNPFEHAKDAVQTLASAALKPAVPPTFTPGVLTSTILPTQLRLAEIIEMIHVASLLHDDVIDQSDTRRDLPSSPSLFGNKLSILAGDFMLARASMALSRLGSNEVVELIASCIANLVEGEVMQMKGHTAKSHKEKNWVDKFSAMIPIRSTAVGLTADTFNDYMEKTYLKTASLIAKSARSAVVLGGCGLRQGWEAGESVKDAAFSFGRNLGIAFQLIDDLLDYTASAADLGKPSDGADLKLGLATAPVLFAWEEYAELGPMVERKFSKPGDVEKARELVLASSGPKRTLELAEDHAALARGCILDTLPQSTARDALVELTWKVLKRSR
ncbi:terpenoid synthase [Atractiella rhizophila]|nr:terpenoid synthase [Atractiella rhizophila]